MSGKKRKSARFSELFIAKLQLKGKNPRQFSIEIDRAYDHVRKVYNGEAFPGPSMLTDICQSLGIDLKKAKKLIDMDRAVDKGWTQAITGKDESLLRIEYLWPKLTEVDRRELVAITEMKTKRQRSRLKLPRSENSEMGMKNFSD